MSKKHPIHLERRDPHEGLRLQSPSAGRNSAIIAEQLASILPEHANVLEIASGTGEHAVASCKARRDIMWRPSDPDERSRQSQNAWRTEIPEQMQESLAIDTTKPDWWNGLESYKALFCANMIHIAPWEAALGYAAGAQHLLGSDGVAILYGPFLEGADTALSNLEFDANLKDRNPLWGVRSLDSVKHIFADVGFNLSARIEMPKNNRILVFSHRNG